MNRRYRSSKYVPTDRPAVQMMTPSDPVTIPFSFTINGVDLKGVIRPDAKFTGNELPNEFIVFLFGTQPFRLFCKEGEWELNIPTEYQGLADQLGLVIVAWYE